MLSNLFSSSKQSEGTKECLKDWLEVKCSSFFGVEPKVQSNEDMLLTVTKSLGVMESTNNTALSLWPMKAALPKSRKAKEEKSLRKATDKTIKQLLKQAEEKQGEVLCSADFEKKFVETGETVIDTTVDIYKENASRWKHWLEGLTQSSEELVPANPLSRLAIAMNQLIKFTEYRCTTADNCSSAATEPDRKHRIEVAREELPKLGKAIAAQKWEMIPLLPHEYTWEHLKTMASTADQILQCTAILSRAGVGSFEGVGPWDIFALSYSLDDFKRTYGEQVEWVRVADD